jgi:hypothetical protein
MHPYPLSPQNLLETVSGWIKGPNIPDLTGRVVVVSGFNSGIGYHTTRALLEHGAEVSQKKQQIAASPGQSQDRRHSCYGTACVLSGHLPGCAWRPHTCLCRACWSPAAGVLAQL